MMVLKWSLFFGVMIYASAVDIRRRIVPTHVHILLFLIGLLGFRMDSLIGLVLGFLPLAVVALCQGNLGGGDVKIAAMYGFVMGASILPSLLIGTLSCLILTPILRRVKKAKEGIPLVPYLSFGCAAILLLKECLI